MNEALKRITDMETSLNECSSATEELTNQLELFEKTREQAIALFHYYGSEEWYADRERKLPADVPAGVLSEDLVYDEITAVRDMALKMLELGTDILKNWII